MPPWPPEACASLPAAPPLLCIPPCPLFPPPPAPASSGVGRSPRQLTSALTATRLAASEDGHASRDGADKADGPRRLRGIVGGGIVVIARGAGVARFDEHEHAPRRAKRN